MQESRSCHPSWTRETSTSEPPFLPVFPFPASNATNLIEEVGTIDSATSMTAEYTFAFLMKIHEKQTSLDVLKHPGSKAKICCFSHQYHTFIIVAAFLCLAIRSDSLSLAPSRPRTLYAQYQFDQTAFLTPRSPLWTPHLATELYSEGGESAAIAAAMSMSTSP